MDLVSVEEIKERMALNDSEEVDSTLTTCIIAATSMLSASLGTDFDSASHTDLFYLDSNDRPPDFRSNFRLRLTKAFLTDDAVVVKVGDTISDITTSVSATEVQINRRKGIVYIPSSYEGYYVSVAYTAGFRKSATGITANLPPQGVKEAMFSLIPLVMNTVQITNRSEEWQSILKEGYNQVSVHLQPFYRGYGLQLKPIET
jgi:hypothetical protein